MAKKAEFQEITKEIFNLACDLYPKWKALNSGIKEFNTRGVNFPDAISESMVCYALGFKRNCGKSGDATDLEGNLIEIKAASKHDDDLSSFSPNTKFDKLFFLRLNQEKDTAEIYDMQMNFSAFEKLEVNKTQSVKEQQNEGRRPRLSLIKIIEQQNLKPCCKIDILKKIVEKI